MSNVISAEPKQNETQNPNQPEAQESAQEMAQNTTLDTAQDTVMAAPANGDDKTTDENAPPQVRI